jgi:hypothetical protein
MAGLNMTAGVQPGNRALPVVIGQATPGGSTNLFNVSTKLVA